MKENHKAVLNFIIAFLKEYGYSPTVREICKGTGYSSSSTVFTYLIEMRNAGIINYKDNSPRTITVTGYQHTKVS